MHQPTTGCQAIREHSRGQQLWSLVRTTRTWPRMPRRMCAMWSCMRACYPEHAQPDVGGDGGGQRRVQVQAAEGLPRAPHRQRRERCTACDLLAQRVSHCVICLLAPDEGAQGLGERRIRFARHLCGLDAQALQHLFGGVTLGREEVDGCVEQIQREEFVGIVRG